MVFIALLFHIISVFAVITSTSVYKLITYIYNILTHVDSAIYINIGSFVELVSGLSGGNEAKVDGINQNFPLSRRRVTVLVIDKSFVE